MRLVVLLLLLVNLALLAWGQGWLGTVETGHEPERMRQEISPEKLHIVGAPEKPAPAIGCRRIEGLQPAEAERIAMTMATQIGWTTHSETLPKDRVALEVKAPTDQLQAVLPDLMTTLPQASLRDCTP